MFFCFLQLWYGRCKFSMIFHEELPFGVFLPYCHFSHFFELKKTRIEFSLRLVEISARDLRSDTISCIWLMMSVPKQPPLKLKSVKKVNQPGLVDRIFLGGAAAFQNPPAC